MPRPRIIALMGLALACSFSATVAAQEPRHPIEIGAGTAGLLVDTDESGAKVTPGVGGWLDVNLTRRLALETRATWFPQPQAIRYEWQGGRTFHFAAGARGTFIQRPTVSLYGLVLPGAIHFTDAAIGTDRLGATTHFSLELGGGAEFHPTARIAARVEWAADLFGIPSAESPPSAPGPNGGSSQVVIPADISGTMQVRAGLAVGLGRPMREHTEQRLPDAWEVGAQVTLSYLADARIAPLRRPVGVNAFGSYRVFEYLYADATLGVLSGPGVTTESDGGRITQLLGGAKLGIRRNRVGVFMKARLGVRRHAAVLTSTTTRPPFSSTRGPAHATALDLGGVVEFYAGRHFLFRFDAGTTGEFSRNVSFVLDGAPLTLRSDSPDSIEMAFGGGWRF